MNVKQSLSMALAAVLLAGCARAAIGLNNNALVRNGAPAPGSFYNAASVQAELRPNTYFSLFFLGYVAAGAQDELLHPNERKPQRGAPPLDARRRVEARDCTQPLVQPEGNLICK